MKLLRAIFLGVCLLWPLWVCVCVGISALLACWGLIFVALADIHPALGGGLLVLSVLVGCAAMGWEDA